MDLKYIAYLSTCNQPLATDAVDKILASAQAYNKKVGVTGALLYDENNFIQYIEGPEESITDVFSRICAASQHNRILQLGSDKIQSRIFDQWHMGFCRAPHSAIQTLTHANWEKSLSAIENTSTENDGLGLLLDYWASFGNTTEGVTT